MNKAIVLPVSGPPVLACGAWLKNTVCVTRGNQAYVSQLIGDLDSAEARLMLEQSVTNLCADLDVQPEMVAHDLHPDFYSTQFAQSYAAQRGLPIVAVQHHHAHIAALCAEHGVIQPVLGLALDGVGLGTDGMPWGGELLCVEGANFQRLGHLAPLTMSGGDRAAREPWRMAAAVLFQLGRGDEIAQRFSNQPGAQTVAEMLQKNLNCPITSSTGRLFDAAAGLLGVSEIQTFEAQAAMLLQNLAQRHGQIAPLQADRRRRRQIVGGRKLPAGIDGDRRMVARVVVDVGDLRIEDHSTKQFGCVLFWLGADSAQIFDQQDIGPAFAVLVRVFCAQYRQAADHARAHILL